MSGGQSCPRRGYRRVHTQGDSRPPGDSGFLPRMCKGGMIRGLRLPPYEPYRIAAVGASLGRLQAWGKDAPGQTRTATGDATVSRHAGTRQEEVRRMQRGWVMVSILLWLGGGLGMPLGHGGGSAAAQTAVEAGQTFFLHTDEPAQATEQLFTFLEH